jgi:tRNA G18 (ribose-2'-O)-methylase SpoU
MSIVLVPIHALHDPRVADYRHIADLAHLHARSLFVAEGRLVVQRLLSLPQWITQSILVTKAAAGSLGAALDSARAPVYLAEQALMSEIAGFHIHRGCLALGSRRPERLLDRTLVAGARRVLILEGVNNPDNVGGLFRSAEAFGVDLVVLGPACGDPLYRKAIRTSMASTLSVPFAGAGEWPAALDLLRAAGFLVVALTPGDGAEPLDAVTRSGAKIAMLVGAEGHGLTDAALAAADIRARIPMAGALDSLNVTTAASIALYHFSLH